ncbi:2900_t:CDS:2 [Paraglomus brasilianum]|uniref:2900_t:CDS:1 n=1 Tax=Paraglomus brasilianum TaxID=144538 RepID=A0A9N8Z030_9GLOM|nr:2900_t:CDS:2 [Paraglomus brasilianum]
MFYSKSNSSKSEKTWDQIPSRDSVYYVLNRLVGCDMLLKKALSVYSIAYRDFCVVINRAEFMAFALAILAVLARLYILTQGWLKEVQACYALLRSWAHCFPAAVHQDEYLLYEGLPDLLEDLPIQINIENRNVNELIAPYEYDRETESDIRIMSENLSSIVISETAKDIDSPDNAVSEKVNTPEETVSTNVSSTIPVENTQQREQWQTVQRKRKKNKAKDEIDLIFGASSSSVKARTSSAASSNSPSSSKQVFPRSKKKKLSGLGQ